MSADREALRTGPTEGHGETLLACERLTAVIGDITVAANLDLALRRGEYWGMLGPNGVGKTTLLRQLAGLAPPRAGCVLFEGRPLHDWPRRALARRLGMLQQHTAYVFDASVLDVALTGRHPHLGRWQREGPAERSLAAAALERVDLSALTGRSVTGLSGGEARRLAFATLLVQDPEVMLLDEPTNHLDFRHQVRLMRTVGDRVYGRGQAAIAALHDVNLAATYCSHVLLLFGDGAWEAGAARDLLTVERLERLYQCPVTAVATAEGPRFHPAFDRSEEGTASLP